jgi:hypothetical protein
MSDDVKILTDLNPDYVMSVRDSDMKRAVEQRCVGVGAEEILCEDFAEARWRSS